MNGEIPAAPLFRVVPNYVGVPVLLDQHRAAGGGATAAAAAVVVVEEVVAVRCEYAPPAWKAQLMLLGPALVGAAVVVRLGFGV